jgi:hypothetical protein
VFGAVIALACAPQVKEARSALFNPIFLGALLFEIFFFIPFGIFLYYFYPDWSWMYFFDPGRLAPRTLNLLGLAAMACYLGALIVGFQKAQFLVRHDRGKAGLAIVGVALLALAVFSLFTFDRLLHIGSYQDYLAGHATLLLRHKVGYLNTLVGAVMAGALFFMIRTFRASPERH